MASAGTERLALEHLPLPRSAYYNRHDSGSLNKSPWRMDIIVLSTNPELQCHYIELGFDEGREGRHCPHNGGDHLLRSGGGS